MTKVFVGEAAEGSPVITTRPPSYKGRYVATGTTIGAEAKNAVLAYIPETVVVEGTPLYVWSVEVERVGNSADVWNATATWGIIVYPVQFDTSGQTQKITHSIQTRGGYAANGLDPDSTPNFQGGIGFDGETFQGCDVTVPTFSWQETHTYPCNRITLNYVKALASITGTTNVGPFRGFAANEVLFLGATGGNQKSETDADINFKFAANPNAANLQLQGFSQRSIQKNGWDYLWVHYREKVVTTNNTSFRVPQPIACYIEQVYLPADWSVMGI